MSSRKEVKRDIIVNSAFELFLEKGYMNTKIIDIADAVGIGKGTFYEYFTSKEELLLEVLSVKVITDYSYVDAIINLDISCHDKLKAFLQFQKECISKYGSNAFALQQQLLGGDPALSHEVMKAIHAVSMHLYNCIYHIICQGMEKKEFKNINPTLAASAIVGAISSYITAKLQDIMHCPPLDEAVLRDIDSWTDDELLSLIFNGIDI